MKMVEAIGAKPGTGGSAGAAIRARRLATTSFPTCGLSARNYESARPALFAVPRRAERILLTGHSHQADEAFEAQQRAWLDAAEFVDQKWGHAAERAAEVRQGFARLLGDAPANIALGQNTHEMVIRLLSALPLHKRRRIVTTDAEFHSVRRQPIAWPKTDSSTSSECRRDR